MTLRHKLADWISGGALTEAEAAIATASRMAYIAREALK